MLDPPDTSAQAEYAVRLAMSRLWVNRRVETFTFVDANTVRRHMSVDLTLRPGRALGPASTVLVPLMLLVKHDLRNLDVRGPDGHPLPVLNTAQNGEVAVHGLATVLRGLVAGLPDGQPDKSVDENALSQIVHDESHAGGIAGTHLADGGALNRQLRHVQDLDVRAPIETLIRDLESSFMLLVPLPYTPDARVVCKLSYDATIQPLPANTAARVYTRANRIVSSFGLTGRVEYFDNLAVGLARSYHAEAVPPSDAFVAEAALTVRRDGASEDEDAKLDDHAFRPHLRATVKARGDTGKLSLIIHARRQELVVPLAFASALIALVLAFFPSHVYQLHTETFAAVLLVPFALTAYYIRSQENSYLTAMLVGARAVAALPLLAAIYALTLTALGRVPPTGGARLSSRFLTEIRIPFLVAGTAAIMLVAACASPTIGDWTRGARRKLQNRPWKSRKERLARGIGVILTLAAAAAVVYCLVCAASIWWKESVPSVPQATITSHDHASKSSVPPLRAGPHRRELRRKDHRRRARPGRPAA